MEFDEEERAGGFTFIVFLLLGGCQCALSLPLGTVGRHVLYDCDIPGHTHLLRLVPVLFSINVSFHIFEASLTLMTVLINILVDSLTLMALCFKTEPSESTV